MDDENTFTAITKGKKGDKKEEYSRAPPPAPFQPESKSSEEINVEDGDDDVSRLSEMSGTI